jgi:hypothetical protein
VRAIDEVKRAAGTVVAPAPTATNAGDSLAIKALDRLGNFLEATGASAKKEEKPKVFFQ